MLFQCFLHKKLKKEEKARKLIQNLGKKLDFWFCFRRLVEGSTCNFYMGGWNFFVPDFNKLPYSLRSQGDKHDLLLNFASMFMLFPRFFSFLHKKHYKVIFWCRSKYTTDDNALSTVWHCLTLLNSVTLHFLYSDKGLIWLAFKPSTLNYDIDVSAQIQFQC